MQLIIAEKPSLGRNIAAGIESAAHIKMQKRKGFLEGGDYLVPSLDGQIFAGFVTTVDGSTVWFDTENQSQGVNSFYPLFVKPLGGDVNGDSKFNIFDLVRYKKYLSGAIGTGIFVSQLGDLNTDGLCNAIDLSATRQLLLGYMPNAQFVPEKYTA